MTSWCDAPLILLYLCPPPLLSLFNTKLFRPVVHSVKACLTIQVTCVRRSSSFFQTFQSISLNPSLASGCLLAMIQPFSFSQNCSSAVCHQCSAILLTFRTFLVVHATFMYFKQSSELFLILAVSPRPASGWLWFGILLFVKDFLLKVAVWIKLLLQTSEQVLMVLYTKCYSVNVTKTKRRLKATKLIWWQVVFVQLWCFIDQQWCDIITISCCVFFLYACDRKREDSRDKLLMAEVKKTPNKQESTNAPKGERRLVGPLRGRRRVPAATQGLPRFSAGAGPARSQWAGPAAAGGGVGPPSEEWAAPSGEQGEETRRSMDGGAPAEDSTNRYIYSSISQSISQGLSLILQGQHSISISL